MSAALLTILLLQALLLNSECRAGKEDFIIALDVGHSKKAGVISARGIHEYVFNQDITKMLMTALIEKGFKKTFIINPNGDKIGLAARPEKANTMDSNLFLSIHHDSVQPIYIKKWMYEGVKRNFSDVYKGYSIFVSQKNERPWSSRYFAFRIGEAMLRDGFSPMLHHAENLDGKKRKLVDHNRGIYEFDELVVLKKTKMPAVLFECGIIVNRDEELNLRNPGIQKRIVSALANAVEEYHLRINEIIEFEEFYP
jgi:N-acetylmuramoyl-L-alanine amidase